jgi:ABC-type amino acid transport substrate-binding protein
MRAVATLSLALVTWALAAPSRAQEGGGDLDDVRRRGVLRHLAVPSAAFVAGGGDGFDVELMREFARRLGVGYELVPTDWPAVLPDLLGRRAVARGTEAARARPAAARADVLASGRTALPPRTRAVAFSTPILVTQVWAVAVAGSEVQPIRPSGRLDKDIAAVRASLAGRWLLGLAGTSLDPSLYRLERTGARLRWLELQADELAAALIQGEGELALLDVAGTMAALRRYPGRLKVIGPVSSPMAVAAAFRPGAPQLRAAFDRFLAEVRGDGTLDRLLERFFPDAQGSSAELLGCGR